MTRRKKYTLSLLIFALLISIFPAVAAAIEADCAFTQEKNDTTLTLILAEEDVLPEDGMAIEPLQNVRTDRIRNVFPDPHLAAVIAEAFGVSQDAFVTQRDLDRVIALEANDRNIQNLQGMQYLHNLREVSFLENRISNLQPLAGLTGLERLLLDDNQIENITPLQNLTRLEWLWLDGNRITNVNALSRMGDLVWLTLWDNQIEDIAPLQNLTNLVALWLADNRIENIGAISNMRQLETLSMANNHVRDLRPLAQLNQMQLIWIGMQEYTFPTRLIGDPFTMTNPLFAPNGTRITPTTMSHGGSYDSPTLFWESLPENTHAVHFDFSEHIYVGQTSDVFSGRITQPTSRTPFSDVNHVNWFYDAVAFVFTENLMGGVSSHQFAPHTSLDRAMAVTVLHRLAGRPEVDFSPVFIDVAEDAWYAPAAMWAFEADVVHGYGQEDIFNPRAAITREQFATLIHRFSKQQEDFLPPPDSFALYQFVDHMEISDWAYEAFRWATYEGIFTGTPQRELNPRGTTSRAECATILMRLQAREISE